MSKIRRDLKHLFAFMFTNQVRPASALRPIIKPPLTNKHGASVLRFFANLALFKGVFFAFFGLPELLRTWSVVFQAKTTAS